MQEKKLNLALERKHALEGGGTMIPCSKTRLTCGSLFLSVGFGFGVQDLGFRVWDVVSRA